MVRMRLLSMMLVVVALLLAVAFPGSASTSSHTIGCSGLVRSGGSATCVSAIQLPHFDPGDGIAYEALVARIVSPHAVGWRVHGNIADAKGKIYLAWECAARSSTVTADSSAYFDRTCQAWRKLRPGSTDYYTADTSKPQVLTVSAWVEGCAPAGPCRFEGAATYLLHG